jgi:signal transduction histidine kinase
MPFPTAQPPGAPTPADQIAAAIENVTPLRGLTLDERLWLAHHGHEVVGQPGHVLFAEGAPAESMIILLKGEIHVRRLQGSSMEMFLGRTGQITGLLPFSRMIRHGGHGIAASAVWALKIPKSLFPEMLAAIPSMGQRAVSTMLDRVREITRIEQQAEKLSALGKLAGNLAHELNNPASAAQRAAASLVTELDANRENHFKLVNLCLRQDQVEAIQIWERQILDRPFSAVPAPLDREEALRTWLAALGCMDAWELAAPLAEQAVSVADLEALRAFLGPAETAASLQFFARHLRSSRLVEAMVHSTARIFDLISAIQSYAFMDRAPILDVDLPACLDATLRMLQSRLSKVHVEREYEPDLPSIPAYGSELNQVWTALIENALDALGDQGTLRLVCRIQAEMLLVEVWDNGPGIAPELHNRIFEPFFTTKGPGLGLGLGLDNAMRIVRKHCGHLSVRSEPGATCFLVRLPLEPLQAY